MYKDTEWPILLKLHLGMWMAVAGMVKLLFPTFFGWGWFTVPVKTSLEHGELMGLISLIGGVVIFYMPTNLKK